MEWNFFKKRAEKKAEKEQAEREEAEKRKAEKIKRKISDILLLVAIVAAISYISAYGIGTEHKLDRLVDKEATDILSVLKKDGLGLDLDIEQLTEQRNELKSEIEANAQVSETIESHNSEVADYNRQVSALKSELETMETDIQSKQSEIEQLEEERKAAVKEPTVWIGETGTKYHRSYCRTLKGNKYEITLSQAKNQGREPCKVCY